MEVIFSVVFVGIQNPIKHLKQLPLKLEKNWFFSQLYWLYWLISTKLLAELNSIQYFKHLYLTNKKIKNKQNTKSRTKEEVKNKTTTTKKSKETNKKETATKN